MSEASRVEEIFCKALEKRMAEERAAYLAESCQDSPELRHKVERLLAAHVLAGDFLEQPPSGFLPTIDKPGDERGDPERDAAIDLAGSWVGPFKLLEMIGEGGMGVVYMAEQQTPIRRRVALKVIKPGLDTRQVVARFEAERQALAMMDHPNIAHVLDAGTTDSGRPYFVMELVRGVPITEYCDLNNLPLQERLELFAQVCHAVQHAHQKGIIHRDIKPSNVLVTLNDARAVPKVIDFGVAKAINQQLTDKTLFTNFAQMVGTPLYMSPEQAEMTSLDVDTRTDIYSLGVLLYELLTGTTPFDRQLLREAAYDEIRRIIREQEPPRPSLRISTLGETRTAVAAHRRADPNRLSHLLRGDLDWIVMKSLEKDRNRRYESASGMAADIQRYLSDQPVEAGPPSATYRFRKLARRNRVAIAIAATILSVLVLATVVSSWQAIRATRAEARAEAALLAEAEQRQKERSAKLLAQAERNKAEDQRALAEQQKRQVEKLAYPVQLERAIRLWDRGNITEARNALNALPRHLRGWEHDYLDTLFKSHVTLKGHLECVESVTFSPDGRWIASGSNDGDIKIWNTKTKRNVRTIEDDTPIQSIAFSPDSLWIASGGRDGNIKIWDTENGREMLALTGHEKDVRSVRFSFNGKQIVSGSDDKTVRIWDAESGQQLRIINGHARAVTCVTFSPDGRRIASTSPKDTIRIWDSQTGIETCSMDCCCVIHRIETNWASIDVDLTKQELTDIALVVAHESHGQVSTIAFSPDGRRLVGSGGIADYVRIWDVETGEEMLRLAGDVDSTGTVAFSPDGRRLVTGGAGDSVKIWDADTGRKLSTLWLQHDAVNSVAFSPDGRQIAAGSFNGLVTVWDSVDTQMPNAFHWYQDDLESNTASNVHRACVAFNPNGRQIASGHGDGKIRVWNTRDGMEPRTIVGHTDVVEGVVFSPDGQQIVSGSADGTVKIWDATTGQAVNTLDVDPRHVTSVALSQNRRLIADPEYVTCVAFSQNGRLIASGGRLGIKIWDVPTGEQTLTLTEAPEVEESSLPSDEERVTSIAISPDSQSIVGGFKSGVAKVWDTMTGQNKFTVDAHTSDTYGHFRSVNSVAFSPDQKWIATCGNEGAIKLWDATTGQEIFTLEGHSNAEGHMFGSAVLDIAISPDSRRIASSSADSMIRIWNTEVGLELLTLTGDDTGGYLGARLAFSPDGRQLVHSSGDRTIILWDASHGMEKPEVGGQARQ